MGAVLVCRSDVRVGPGQGHRERSGDEERAITIGQSARERVLFVEHTEREDCLRIASARRATRQEQDQYEEGIDETTP